MKLWTVTAAASAAIVSILVGCTTSGDEVVVVPPKVGTLQQRDTSACFDTDHQGARDWIDWNCGGNGGTYSYGANDPDGNHCMSCNAGSNDGYYNGYSSSSGYTTSSGGYSGSSSSGGSSSGSSSGGGGGGGAPITPTTPVTTPDPPEKPLVNKDWVCGCEGSDRQYAVRWDTRTAAEQFILRSCPTKTGVCVAKDLESVYVKTKQAKAQTDFDLKISEVRDAIKRDGGSSDNLDKLPWSICDHLRPLKKFEHQYFFTGGSVGAAGFVVGGQAGVDVVFDIYNMQAAVFGYAKRVTASSNASISAGGYVGYGFGDKGDVITAWSGQFIDDVGSIETPWLNLSASLGYFHAPDNTISGAYVGVGIGTSLLPIPVGYDHTIGVWEAWDAGAIGMAAQSPGSTIGHVTAQPWSGKPAHDYAYVQYPDAFSLAMAIRRAAPGAIGEAAALDAIALALAREAGVTISQLCPASGVAASLPAPPPGGQCVFGAYADVSVALRSCNNQIQPCQSGYNCK